LREMRTILKSNTRGETLWEILGERILRRKRNQATAKSTPTRKRNHEQLAEEPDATDWKEEGEASATTSSKNGKARATGKGSLRLLRGERENSNVGKRHLKAGKQSKGEKGEERKKSA